MSDFNRKVGHKDYPTFEGWLSGQNPDDATALVVVKKPGNLLYKGKPVRETQNIWYPIDKLVMLVDTGAKK